MKLSFGVLYHKRKNKTITVIVGEDDNPREIVYTQKELIKCVKKLIKDYISGKVQEDTDYDYDEWCNPMLHKLKLLEKVL